MRRYAVNSHEAVCRLLALSLLSDGGLDPAELAAVRESRLLAQLGISEPLLQQVLQDLCDDLLQYLPGQAVGHLELDTPLLDRLLAEVDDPALQVKLLRAMLGVVDADGWLADGEAVLISRAMACWQYDWYAVQPIPGQPRTARSVLRS
ncbi:TerB family tellurite resistance protein [Chitinibacter sp. ZOR0017]|uniref:tellurite resistance TerB family protein n=1 Tax=Chitinibacter sp. ZOR0017 TaxID=1339254 RepID=UPI00068F75E8|nr:TerB family tellurite resistance protein [Chitinibacter sp. ZOR0017]